MGKNSLLRLTGIVWSSQVVRYNALSCCHMHGVAAAATLIAARQLFKLAAGTSAALTAAWHALMPDRLRWSASRQQQKARGASLSSSSRRRCVQLLYVVVSASDFCSVTCCPSAKRFEFGMI